MGAEIEGKHELFLKEETIHAVAAFCYLLPVAIFVVGSESFSGLTDTIAYNLWQEVTKNTKLKVRPSQWVCVCSIITERKWCRRLK